MSKVKKRMTFHRKGRNYIFYLENGKCFKRAEMIRECRGKKRQMRISIG
jgi:hypothetical protein